MLVGKRLDSKSILRYVIRTLSLHALPALGQIRLAFVVFEVVSVQLFVVRVLCWLVGSFRTGYFCVVLLCLCLIALFGQWLGGQCWVKFVQDQLLIQACM